MRCVIIAYTINGNGHVSNAVHRGCICKETLALQLYMQLNSNEFSSSAT